MKKRILILLALNLLLLTNCNKEEKKIEENKTEQAEVVVNEVIENKKIKFTDESYDLFEKFANNKNDVIEKLKSLNKEEANKLLKQYMIDNQILLDNIDEKTFDFLSTIYFNENEEDNFTENDVKDLNKLLNKYSLGLYDVGEGIVLIKVAPDFYYNIFKDYVTDDGKEYLTFITKEEKEPYQADGTIMVNFEEIGERIITLENFLNKYPDSIFNDEIKDKLNLYRVNYLLGADATPTIENNNIIEENLKEFNEFMKKYPNSPTVELIEYFLENYKDKDISSKIWEKLEILEKNDINKK